MPTILITGGAGYIGSQTTLELIKQGYETVVFDTLIYGTEGNVSPESTFYKGDLQNIHDLEAVFQKHTFDAVIHFAAFLQVGESMADPEKYYYNNVYGTLNLIQVMKKYQTNRIIFSSTAAVYGLPKELPITEETLTDPINTYGYSKLVMEHIMDDYNRAYGLNSIRLRYFNACGADKDGRTGETHEPETHLIPNILLALTGHNDHFTVFGTDYNTKDGTCIRDYISTTDLATAHVKALEVLLQSNQSIATSINLGSGNGYSVKEIIDAVERITGKKVPVEYGTRRAGDPDVLVANPEKARKVLGWKAEYSDLDFIISTAWNWHLKCL